MSPGSQCYSEIDMDFDGASGDRISASSVVCYPQLIPTGNNCSCDIGLLTVQEGGGLKVSSAGSIIGGTISSDGSGVLQETNDDIGCTNFTPCVIDQQPIQSRLFLYDEFTNDYRRYSSNVGETSVVQPWDGFWVILVADDVANADWTLHLPPYESQFMFVTDEEFTADSFSINGGSGSGEALDYADSLCQIEADNAGLLGSYRAWLSDSSQSPAAEFTQFTTPYIRPDGVVVADTYTDLTDGNISTPISITGTLKTPSNSFVWTGTGTNGIAMAAPNGLQPFCGNWSSADSSSETFVGNSTATSAPWTIAPLTVGCGAVSAHLYCAAQ